jgi:hypothetical protein
MSGRSGCRAVPGVPCGMGGLGEGCRAVPGVPCGMGGLGEGCRAVPGVPCGMGGLGEGGWVWHGEVLTCHRLWGHGHEGLWGHSLLLSWVTQGR